MKLKNSSDEVSLSVLWRGFERYKFGMLKSDSLSALSVALLSVPLSMAYALAAGLPPSVGIFATIFGTIFAAAFGSSRHLIVGPTNTVAILIQSGISEILYTYYRDVPDPERGVLAVNILIQLTLVVGILQFLAGCFKLGKLTQFVSRSVVMGYVIGASLAIIVSQLFNFFGIASLDRPAAIYEKAEYLFLNFSKFSFPTLLIGGGSLFFLLITLTISKRFPAAVVMLILATLVVYLDFPEGSVSLVKHFGQFNSIFPHIEMPFFDLHIMNTLLPIAFAIALLGVLESTTIARTIAAHTGQVLSMNQEIFALGATNLFGSFLGSMPSSGSFARSSLNYSSGAKTRLSAVLSGLFVALIFYALLPLIMQIPLAALSAILLLSAVRMINFNELKLCLKATGSDALVLITTALSCILFNVDVGFYVGVVLSIVFYLQKASTPRFVESLLGEDGELKTLVHPEKSLSRPIRVLQVEGELFFAAAALLQTTVRALAQDPNVKVIVLHMAGAYHVDATACVVLQHLNQTLKKTDRSLIASGLSRQMWQVFCDSGLTLEIGQENLFLTCDRAPHESSIKALSRAEELVSIYSSKESSSSGQGDLDPSTGSHFNLAPSKGTVS